MKDPIGSYNSIRENLLQYVKTAFGTQYPALELERDRLLRMPGVVSRDPWVEALPKYQSSGKSIEALTADDMPGLTAAEAERFKRLAACGLIGDFPLYTHQLQMLSTALSGRHCVVTAGTGSGKTESFLLPLFAYLAKESVRAEWQSPAEPAPHTHDWWKNQDWLDSCYRQHGNRTRIVNTLRVPQRGHETREAAVRGLILYPMNALVEDQLSRLRRALDSPDAERLYESAEMERNRFYFSRYNGSTPVAGQERTRPGNPNRARCEDLAEKLRRADRASEAADQHAQSLRDEARACRERGQDAEAKALEQMATEVTYFFPHLTGSEMRSRWDMQQSPPDVLITNYSMLSIMLMRDADSPIFRRTREWLERPGRSYGQELCLTS